METKTLTRPEDETIWPLENDQERVVANKPVTIPNFLSAARQASAQKKPKPTETSATTSQTGPLDIPQGDLGLLDTTLRSEINVPTPALAKKFPPLFPHLHKMMDEEAVPERRVNMTEPLKINQVPDWVQETAQKDDEPGRSPVFKGLAIAACLFLISGVGLTVAAMEFKGSPNAGSAAWNTSIASLLPSFNLQTKQIKPLPVVVPETLQVEDATSTASVTPIAPVPAKIGSVKLTVLDAKGAAQSPIRLEVMAESGENVPPIAVRLTGLPAEAKLSAGSKQSDQAWIVMPAELTNLDLTLLKAPASPLKVTVAAIETETGDLAAPMQEMIVKVDRPKIKIEPAALPVVNSRNYSSDATAVPLPIPATDEAAIAMRARGDQTLALGDVTGAREFYKIAMKMGDVTSAARIGRTYDPVVYKAVGVHGLKPDPALARRWYELAISEGDATAREDLSRLTQSTKP